MEKIIEDAIVISQEELLPGIFSLKVKSEIAKTAKCGQFVSLYSKDSANLLPRPISLCQINAKESSLRMVYRVVGKGTEEFSRLTAGDTIHVMGPLGNGFPVLSGKKVMLIGGGIGLPPMVGTAEAYAAEATSKSNIISVMGYRDKTFLQEELRAVSESYIATEDGSLGTKGTVIDAIKANGLKADVILACGPKPMLRAIKTFAEENQMECYVSMEERMACGIGACLACVCQTSSTDDHSKVNNTRICKDGPVFNAKDIVL